MSITITGRRGRRVIRCSATEPAAAQAMAEAWISHGYVVKFRPPIPQQRQEATS